MHLLSIRAWSLAYFSSVEDGTALYGQPRTIRIGKEATPPSGIETEYCIHLNEVHYANGHGASRNIPREGTGLFPKSSTVENGGRFGYAYKVFPRSVTATFRAEYRTRPPGGGAIRKSQEEVPVGKNIVQKIIDAHYVSGDKKPGKEVAVRIDQTLTQDATGTMAYLQFEAMGVPRVKTEKSVSYVDHNTLQEGFENADDHLYLQTVAAKHGIFYSRAGNGICHQVHVERFGAPGKTMLGSDSHTPTGGGIGMMAIGAGGLDVAVAMAGGPFYMTYPKVVKVNLTGKLQPWVAAKDVILKLLEILTTKGNVGTIVEYGGDGVETLSVPERATITNMGAELGVTTSIFPSDKVTKAFLKAQGREEAYDEAQGRRRRRSTTG